MRCMIILLNKRLADVRYRVGSGWGKIYIISYVEWAAVFGKECEAICIRLYIIEVGYIV